MARRSVTLVDAAEAPKMLKVSFAAAKVTDVGMVDPASKSIKFACLLGRGFEKLFDRMNWQVPGDHVTEQKLEAVLEGGNFILTASDKLVEAEVDLDFGKITGFSCVRRELEGKKGKGFRRELKFSATLKNANALALIEGYMNECDNARGTLVVSYLEKPVQVSMEDGDAQMKLDEERKAATGKDAD